MTARPQRGSRVIYVAASAREFPQDVQDWLAQPGLRAAVSPNIYDALAELASGRTPLALLVSIESVDWSELEFFAHARRLCPDMLIHVAGDAHHEAKLEAAMARGAQRFDGELLNEMLSAMPPASRSAGPAGLLAGSLRTDVEIPEPSPRLAPPEPPEPEIFQPTEETERPSVRLVSTTETEETETPVPFPWTPAATRPQRTPPKTTKAPGNDAPETESKRRKPPSVKLTPEELSALLEQSPAPDVGKAQEGGS